MTEGRKSSGFSVDSKVFLTIVRGGFRLRKPERQEHHQCNMPSLSTQKQKANKDFDSDRLLIILYNLNVRLYLFTVIKLKVCWIIYSQIPCNISTEARITSSNYSSTDENEKLDTEAFLKADFYMFLSQTSTSIFVVSDRFSILIEDTSLSFGFVHPYPSL